jgi:hypothetical protein
MANPSYLALATMKGQILYSGQLATTTSTAIYTVPASTTVKLSTGTVCNTSGLPVTVSVSLHKVGDTADGTHRVVSGYSLAAADTLSLRDYLSGAMLAEGESVNIIAGTAAVLDVVLTGSVSA